MPIMSVPFDSMLPSDFPLAVPQTDRFDALLAYQTPVSSNGAISIVPNPSRPHFLPASTESSYAYKGTYREDCTLKIYKFCRSGKKSQNRHSAQFSNFYRFINQADRFEMPPNFLSWTGIRQKGPEMAKHPFSTPVFGNRFFFPLEKRKRAG